LVTYTGSYVYYVETMMKSNNTVYRCSLYLTAQLQYIKLWFHFNL